MNRTTIRYGTAAALAAVIAASAAAACKPKTLALLEPPKVSAENENEVVGAPPTYLGGPEDHPSLTTLKVRPTPILTHPIESYSDRDLVEYLDSLQYDADTATSEVDSVTCIHQPSGVPCGPTEAARVFIEPEVGMNKWAKPTIPKYGLIVSRIINYDVTDRAEAHF